MLFSTPAPAPAMMLLKGPQLDLDTTDTSDPGYSSATSESDASIDVWKSCPTSNSGGLELETIPGTPSHFAVDRREIDEASSSETSEPEDPLAQLRPPPGLEQPLELAESEHGEDEVNILCYGPHGSPKRHLKRASSCTTAPPLERDGGSVLAYGPHGSPKRQHTERSKQHQAAHVVLTYGPHGSPKRSAQLTKKNILQSQSKDSTRCRTTEMAEEAQVNAASGKAILSYGPRGSPKKAEEPVFSYGPHGSPTKTETQFLSYGPRVSKNAGETVFSYGPHGSPKKAEETVFSYGPHGSPKKSSGRKTLLGPVAPATTKRVARAPATTKMPMKIPLPEELEHQGETQQEGAAVFGNPVATLSPIALDFKPKDGPGELGKPTPKLSPTAPEFKPTDGSGDVVKVVQKMSPAAPEFKPLDTGKLAPKLSPAAPEFMPREGSGDATKVSPKLSPVAPEFTPQLSPAAPEFHPKDGAYDAVKSPPQLSLLAPTFVPEEARKPCPKLSPAAVEFKPGVASNSVAPPGLLAPAGFGLMLSTSPC